MNQENEKKKINLFTLGESTVGKSCFIRRFCKDVFSNDYLATFGFDCMLKDIKLKNGEILKLNFHDTAGQEKYRSVAFNLIRNADGIFLMYDISKQRTFEAIDMWIKSVNDVKGEDFPKILIGNKCDLDEEREIQKSQGKEKAEEYKMEFFECSNKTNINIKESVMCLVKQILNKQNSIDNNNISLSSENTNIKIEKKNCGC